MNDKIYKRGNPPATFERDSAPILTPREDLKLFSGVRELALERSLSLGSLCLRPGLLLWHEREISFAREDFFPLRAIFVCCEWDLSVRLPLVVIFSGFRIAKCYRDSPWHVFVAWVLMVFITSPLLVLLSPFSFLDLVSSVIFYTSFFYPVFSSFLSPSLHNLSLFLPLLPLIPTFPLSFVLFYTSYFLSQFSAFLSSLPHNLPLFPPLPPPALIPLLPL